MTDRTFAHLEDIVEQALKPVWASRSRTQMLRMELLAHVMDIFDEEFAILSDEQAALNQTLCRFGLAEAVGTELQSSLSFANRWLPFLFKENLMKSWLWFVAVVAVFVGMGFVMPAVAQLRQTGVAVHLIPYTLGMFMAVAGVVAIGRAFQRRALIS